MHLRIEEVQCFIFSKWITYCFTPIFKWTFACELIELLSPVGGCAFGLLTLLICVCSCVHSGAGSPVVFCLRTFLHTCLLSTVLSFHTVPFTRGASLAVYHRHVCASRWIWCENICSSQEHIFPQDLTPSLPSSRSDLSHSLSHPWHLPASVLQHQLMVESWMVSIWVENVPAFLTLSLTDCLINLLILSIVELAGVLERRAMAHHWSLSLSSSFTEVLSVRGLGAGLCQEWNGWDPGRFQRNTA